MKSTPQFLVTVFDALRPDMVTPALTPNLCRFISEGCLFRNSRAVFPTSTYTNAASLATGATVSRHGIIGNRYFDPNVFTDRLFQPGRGDHIDAGQAAYGGRLYTAPSIGELVTEAGYRAATITSGNLGTGRPFDPKAPTYGRVNLALNEWVASAPSAVARLLIERFGEIPATGRPDFARIERQTDILLDFIYPECEPDVALVWFTDPDQTYHYLGIDSEESLQAIRHVDAQFGRILEWWRSSDLAERLQIIAVSDHGHLTTGKRIDVNREAAAAGLKIGDHFIDGVNYAGYTSYSGSVRVRDGDQGLRRALVEWLSDRPWCGIILTGGGDGVEGGVPGTFDFALMHMDHQRTPDVSYVMRNDGGRCYFNGDYPEGGGTHGGLHPDELNNLLAVQGSLFKSGHVSDLAAGIIDVAPTILAAIGVPRPVSMQGRVLAEGLADSHSEPPQAIATMRTVRRGSITQHLRYTELGGTRYLDRGWVE